MAATIREQIIAAFTARAAALSTLSVDRVKRSLTESNERFVSIWDGDDSGLQAAYTTQRLSFPIAVECIWKTVDHSIEANALIGEIIALMIGTDRTFGGLAVKTEYQSAAPRYPQEGSKQTTLTVIFNITYDTVLGDPYTQRTP